VQFEPIARLRIDVAGALEARSPRLDQQHDARTQGGAAVDSWRPAIKRARSNHGAWLARAIRGWRRGACQWFEVDSW